MSNSTKAYPLVNRGALAVAVVWADVSGSFVRASRWMMMTCYADTSLWKWAKLMSISCCGLVAADLRRG